MNEREHLEQEINKLRHELSVTIPQEMQDAIEAGDLRENSEFSEVVNRQYFASVRLKQLIDRFNSYKAINLNHVSRTRIGIGSEIKVKNVDEKTIINFKIVIGEITDEISSDYVKITLNSPIGKALYDKQVNDQVTVLSPSGRSTYKILKIKTLHEL